MSEPLQAKPSKGHKLGPDLSLSLSLSPTNASDLKAENGAGGSGYLATSIRSTASSAKSNGSLLELYARSPNSASLSHSYTNGIQDTQPSASAFSSSSSSSFLDSSTFPTPRPIVTPSLTNPPALPPRPTASALSDPHQHLPDQSSSATSTGPPFSGAGYLESIPPSVSDASSNWTTASATPVYPEGSPSGAHSKRASVAGFDPEVIKSIRLGPSMIPAASRDWVRFDHGEEGSEKVPSATSESDGSQYDDEDEQEQQQDRKDVKEEDEGKNANANEPGYGFENDETIHDVFDRNVGNEREEDVSTATIGQFSHQRARIPERGESSLDLHPPKTGDSVNLAAAAAAATSAADDAESIYVNAADSPAVPQRTSSFGQDPISAFAGPRSRLRTSSGESARSPENQDPLSRVTKRRPSLILLSSKIPSRTSSSEGSQREDAAEPGHTRSPSERSPMAFDRRMESPTMSSAGLGIFSSALTSPIQQRDSETVVDTSLSRDASNGPRSASHSRRASYGSPRSPAKPASANPPASLLPTMSSSPRSPLTKSDLDIGSLLPAGSSAKESGKPPSASGTPKTKTRPATMEVPPDEQARLEAELLKEADPSRPRTLKEARALAKLRKQKSVISELQSSPDPGEGLLGPVTAPERDAGKVGFAAAVGSEGIVRRSIDSFERPERNPRRRSARDSTDLPRLSTSGEPKQPSKSAAPGSDHYSSAPSDYSNNSEVEAFLDGAETNNQLEIDGAGGGLTPGLRTRSRGSDNEETYSAEPMTRAGSALSNAGIDELTAAVSMAMEDLSFGDYPDSVDASLDQITPLARGRSTDVGPLPTTSGPLAALSKGKELKTSRHDDPVRYTGKGDGIDRSRDSELASSSSPSSLSTPTAPSLPSRTSSVRKFQQPLQTHTLLQQQQMAPSPKGLSNPSPKAAHPLSPMLETPKPQSQPQFSTPSTASSQSQVVHGRSGYMTAQTPRSPRSAKRLEVYGRTIPMPRAFVSSTITVDKKKAAPWERARSYAVYTNELLATETGLSIWTECHQRPAMRRQKSRNVLDPFNQDFDSGRGRGQGGHARDEPSYASSIRSEATFPMRGDGGKAKEITTHTLPSMPESPPNKIPTNIPYPTLIGQSNSSSNSLLSSSSNGRTRTLSNGLEETDFENSDQNLGAYGHSLSHTIGKASGIAPQVSNAGRSAGAFFSSLGRKGSKRTPGSGSLGSISTTSGSTDYRSERGNGLSSITGSVAGPRAPRAKGKMISKPLLQQFHGYASSERSSIDGGGGGDYQVDANHLSPSLHANEAQNRSPSRLATVDEGPSGARNLDSATQVGAGSGRGFGPSGPRAPGGGSSQGGALGSAGSGSQASLSSLARQPGGPTNYSSHKNSSSISSTSTQGGFGGGFLSRGAVSPATVQSSRSTGSSNSVPSTVGLGLEEELAASDHREVGSKKGGRENNVGFSVKSSFSYGSVREKLRGGSANSGGGGGGGASTSSNSSIDRRDEAFEEALSKISDILPDADEATLAYYLRKANGNDLVAIGDYLQDQSEGKLPSVTNANKYPRF
ncbi:hypothetical protein IE53DRAFT_241061 [Violaceomyces palustris]|uniref:Uncharacterized protein n=1 Tax=Violaceomyces palustris TaxID=1673888 RepID=A0ACD0NP72_9BASI|nr:hypothetical protein IE53DRAFT_241061 [Violaceomyces palustris]